MNPVHSFSRYFPKIHSNIISHLRLGFPSGHLPSVPSLILIFRCLIPKHPSLNPQAGRPLLVGCPQLLIQCIRSYLHIWRPSPPSTNGGRSMSWGLLGVPELALPSRIYFCFYLFVFSCLLISYNYSALRGCEKSVLITFEHRFRPYVRGFA